MAERRIPTKAEVESYLRDRRNWGRWGNKGSAGAINLITPEKRRSAAKLVRTGRSVSLSRPFPVVATEENPMPAQHYVMKTEKRFGGGSAVDYYGVFYHGYGTTHVDALCHVWDKEAMWDGRDPAKEISYTGSTYGSVDQWSDGILTRGILLNVPKHRGKPYVTLEEPVHGWELDDIVKEEGLKLEPGDAVFVYSNREGFKEAGGVWDGHLSGMGPLASHPGLHASCLPFIRDNDISLVGWDMLDSGPNEYGLDWTVHGAIFSYGVALLDNCLLQPLVQACDEEGRSEFMVTINPLNVIGGTGSPVNPIAVF